MHTDAAGEGAYAVLLEEAAVIVGVHIRLPDPNHLISAVGDPGKVQVHALARQLPQVLLTRLALGVATRVVVRQVGVLGAVAGVVSEQDDELGRCGIRGLLAACARDRQLDQRRQGR